MLGRLLGSRYKIVEVLGSGGFGQTYIAEDIQRPGNPRCVLKHLNFTANSPAMLQQARRLFFTEAETLERLGHHHQIPQLLAYFEEDAEFYLVQELITGHPLSAELPWGRKLPETQVIAILEDVLGILAFVHGEGVIHRDIKPDNLIRREQDGRLVLIDFGAVKTIGNTIAEVQGQSQFSIPVYTSGYAASEHCLGRPQFSSDLYSLGVIAIQALTGMRPAQIPQDPNTLELVWRDQAEVSDALAEVVERMVQYHFGRRYQAASDALAALEQARQGIVPDTQLPDHPRTLLPLKTQAQPPAVESGPTRLQIPLLWKITAGFGVAACGAIATFFLLRGGTPLPVPTPPSATQAVADPRISQGEQILTPGEPDLLKQKATDWVTMGRYDQAIAALETARRKDPTDPETLIYLNNARIGQKPAYTIAVVVPLGTVPLSSSEVLRGVAQAQQQINQAGGINGLGLRVAIATDDNQPDTARQIAQRLAQDPTILGVIGHGSSDTTLAAGQIYQEQQLVVVAPVSSAVQLSEFGSYVFRTMPSDQFPARQLSDHLLSRLGKQRVAIFYNAGSTYSRSYRDEFKKALFYRGKGKVVAEVDLSRPDFNPVEGLEQARQNKAEVILLAASSEVIDRALLVVQVNRRRLPLLAGDSLYNPRTLQIGGEEALGMVLAVPSERVQVEGSRFSQQATQLWGQSVSWRSVLAYDALQALVAGIRQNPTRNGIQQVLSNPAFVTQGAGRPVKFLPSGDREGTVQLVQVRPGTAGSPLKYQFQPLP